MAGVVFAVIFTVGLISLIVITIHKSLKQIDAANGWYKYTTRFALPVYGQDGNIERYNVFRGFMIIRYDQDGNKYLYDVIKIKKETSNPPSC